MKLIPVGHEILGRFVIERADAKILLSDELSKTTALVLIDAVGVDAEAAGWKVGDVILPFKVTKLPFRGGSILRPGTDGREIRYRAEELDRERLFVQNDGATAYVAFDDPTAATPMGYSESLHRSKKNGASEHAAGASA